MYRASDAVAERPWIEVLDRISSDLDLEEETVSVASELFLSELPLPDRSKRATLAASCYTACLITGDERSQGTIAEAFDVSRLSIQKRWKSQLESVGFSAPDW